MQFLQILFMIGALIILTILYMVLTPIIKAKVFPRNMATSIIQVNYSEYFCGLGKLEGDISSQYEFEFGGCRES